MGPSGSWPTTSNKTTFSGRTPSPSTPPRAKNSASQNFRWGTSPAMPAVSQPSQAAKKSALSPAPRLKPSSQKIPKTPNPPRSTTYWATFELSPAGPKTKNTSQPTPPKVSKGVKLNTHCPPFSPLPKPPPSSATSKPTPPNGSPM